MKKIILCLLVGFLVLVGAVYAQAVTKDVAYVVKDTSNPNPNLIQALNDLGYSYDLIDDSIVSSTNFNNYGMILLGNENIKNVPVENHKSLVMDPNYYSNWSNGKISLTSNHILTAFNINSGIEITDGIMGRFNVYTATKTPSGQNIPYYYLSGKKKTGVASVTTVGDSTTDKTKFVVAVKNEPKRVFYGITETEYWTATSKQLFENSLKWVLEERLNNPPTFEGPINDIEWEVNTGARLELSDYFNDEDGDVLTYDVSDTSTLPYVHVNINKQTGLVLFTADNNWIGEDWIIFKAIDEHGAETVTNRINLRVMSATPASRAPVLQTINDLNVYSGSLVKIVPVATDEDTPQADLIFIYRYPLNNSGEWQIPESTVGVFTTVVRVEDPEGNFDEKQFKINVIDSNTPVINNIGNKVVIEGQLLSFSVTATDPTDDILNLSAMNLPTGATFVDNGNGNGLFRWTPNTEQSGNYQITFKVVDDNGYLSNLTISIKVNNLIEAPDFSDADICETTSDLITIDIKNPDDGDDFKISDGVDVDVNVENNADVNLDVDVKFYLYDLDNDENLDDKDANADIDKGKDEDFEEVLEIPRDIEDDSIVVLVVAEGTGKIGGNRVNYCNFQYVDINIERESHDLIIDSVDVTPNSVSPGGSVEVKTKILNIGEEDEEVYIEVINNVLGIKQKSETFDIEKFGDKDSATKSLRFNIPQNATEGTYELSVNVYYNGNDVRSKNANLSVVKNTNSNSNGNNEEGKGLIRLGDQLVDDVKNSINLGSGNKIKLTAEEDKSISPTKKSSVRMPVFSEWRFDNETMGIIFNIVNITLFISIIILIIGIIWIRS